MTGSKSGGRRTSRRDEDGTSTVSRHDTRLTNFLSLFFRF